MSPGDIDTILRRLDTQDSKQNEHGRILAEIKGDVKEVKREVKTTNGRVTNLETKAEVAKALAEQETHAAEIRREDTKDRLGRHISIEVGLITTLIAGPVLVVAYLVLELIKTGHF